MEDTVNEEVLTFVATQLSVRHAALAPTTDLLHDLGVDGDDASEFMQAFAERFHVRLSGLDLSRHFGPETGCNPICWVYWHLFAKEKLHLIPVTMGDLIRVAREKDWRYIDDKG